MVARWRHGHVAGQGVIVVRSQRQSELALTREGGDIDLTARVHVAHIQ
jgi:hypothetical protein